MDAEIAVIGGVDFEIDGEICTIETPYGNVLAKLVNLGKREVIFISRHGEKHQPPHRVNYRAILCAVKQTGADRVISINTVGAMSWHPVGSFIIPYDFIEFTKTRPNTFFDDAAVHVEMSQPYCPQLRSILTETMRSMEIVPHDGVYVCAEGPHLETPAQIKMMRNFGDVVGMTGYPEVVLARELLLCYASLCIVTNAASWMGVDALSLSKLMDEMKGSREKVKDIIAKALPNIPTDRSCACKDALQEAKL